MSEIKVDTVKGRDGQVLLGDSGDTISVPSGATLTTTDATVNTGNVTATTESKTNKISPASGTAFTLGDSGDTFTIPSGVTMANSGTASGFGAGPVWISTTTASSSASVDITSGFTSTYDKYMIVLVNVRPATNSASLQMFGTVAGDAFTVNMPTSMFRAYHFESDGAAGVSYEEAGDVANGYPTRMTHEQENGADASASGIFNLYDPSNTTYVKQWIAHVNGMNYNAASYDYYTGGYFNTASAITGIKFSYSSGNIAAGKFKLYGVV